MGFLDRFRRKRTGSPGEGATPEGESARSQQKGPLFTLEERQRILMKRNELFRRFLDNPNSRTYTLEHAAWMLANVMSTIIEEKLSIGENITAPSYQDLLEEAKKLISERHREELGREARKAFSDGDIEGAKSNLREMARSLGVRKEDTESSVQSMLVNLGVEGQARQKSTERQRREELKGEAREAFDRGDTELARERLRELARLLGIHNEKDVEDRTENLIRKWFGDQSEKPEIPEIKIEDAQKAFFNGDTRGAAGILRTLLYSDAEIRKMFIEWEKEVPYERAMRPREQRSYGGIPAAKFSRPETRKIIDALQDEWERTMEG